MQPEGIHSQKFDFNPREGVKKRILGFYTNKKKKKTPTHTHTQGGTLPILHFE